MSTDSTLDSYLISAVSGLTIGSYGVIVEFALGLSLLCKHFFGRDKIRLSELSFDEKALPISGLMIYFWGFLMSLAIVGDWIYRISFDEYTPLTSQNPLDINRKLLRLRIAHLSCFTFGYISLYLFLVCRLYTTFKQSIYEIRPFVIKIYIGILILSVSVSTTSLVLMVFGFDRFTMFLLPPLALFYNFVQLFICYTHSIADYI